jgi:hypothetical protein
MTSEVPTPRPRKKERTASKMMKEKARATLKSTGREREHETVRSR